MKQSKIFIPVVLLLLSSHSLFGQQDIPKIGLVDSNEIMVTYFKDSKAMRDLQSLQESILEESRAIEDEILSLKSQKLDAEKFGNEDEALRLEGLILQRENYLKEWQRIRNEELRTLQQSAMEDAFLSEVYEAIEYIAISEGYSIIFDKRNPFLLYWGLDIDITEKVLRHLLETSGQ